MLGIAMNTKTVQTCVRVIRNLATVQSRARKRLLTEVTTVCDKCDAGYSHLLARLEPVKATFREPVKFASALRSLSADKTARRNFKPERLCSEVDSLLADLSSYLNALPYSVNVSSLKELRETLRSMGQYDQRLYHQYDEFMREMSALAVAIESESTTARKALVAHARAEILQLEKDLQASVTDLRKAKEQIVRLM